MICFSFLQVTTQIQLTKWERERGYKNQDNYLPQQLSLAEDSHTFVSEKSMMKKFAYEAPLHINHNLYTGSIPRR